MTCMHCGAPILANAPFCDQCGKQQIHQPEGSIVPTPSTTTGQSISTDSSSVATQPEHPAANVSATNSTLPDMAAISPQPVGSNATPNPVGAPVVLPPMTSFPGSGHPPAYTPYPGAYLPTPPPEPREPHKIARPLPRWIFLGGIALIIAALAALQFTGSDWADGTLHIALGAISVGALLILATVIRTAAGMSSLANPTRVRQYVSAILLIVVLFMSSGVALLIRPMLHIAQAGNLESQQQWALAIKEYQLGGEKAPTSLNLARVYIEWGEALSKAQQYEQGISKFNTMLSYSTQAAGLQDRARQDELNAYIDWGKQAMNQQDYAAASQHFDTALNLANCDSACKNNVGGLDATAYYNVAEAALASKSYESAVNTFKSIQSKFPNAPEVKQMHGDLARALSGKGKQEKSQLCTSAIPTYKELANNFKDTPEGRQAGKDLKAPQPVKGRFTRPRPGDPFFVALLQGFAVIDNQGTPNMSNAEFFQRLDSAP
ncbi:MAG: hypothetical protein J2P36_31900, partial [Ktedonobacteraceae bacterium]|nr:hypothetical protein [Ktedonobacteraceae bacterium]